MADPSTRRAVWWCVLWRRSSFIVVVDAGSRHGRSSAWISPSSASAGRRLSSRHCPWSSWTAEVAAHGFSYWQVRWAGWGDDVTAKLATSSRPIHGQLTLWRPLLSYGHSHNKASCARPGLAVICNFWHPGTPTLRAERQSTRMSKITSDDLTQSGTGCFI